jgi:glycerol-3-phosphate acyltransferase PlsY
VQGDDLPLLVFSSVVAAFVIAKHRANIKRILQGTENRLGGRKASYEES